MKFGLISQERYNKFLEKKENIAKEVERLKKQLVRPTEEFNKMLVSKGTTPISEPVRMIELLKRTEIKYDDLTSVDVDRPILNKAEREQIDIQIKYEGYIKLQLTNVEKFKKLESKLIPREMDYTKIKGMSLEGIQKLQQFEPTSVGQASRISGVSPADINVLLMYLERGVYNGV